MNIAKLAGLERPLVLASKSPRRIALLKQLGLKFEIIPADIDESAFTEAIMPEKYVMLLSLAKADRVARQIPPGPIVIGADTVVALGGKILNKPENKSHAVEMLGLLSGQVHTVYTGFSFVDSASGKKTSSYQETKVAFRELSAEEKSAYADTGSPMDKAGAYGIQDDFGAIFVKEINGCYYNIVGLPLEKFYVTLRNFLKED